MGSEFFRLGGRKGKLSDPPDISNLRACIRQDKVARRGPSHVVVELALGAVALGLRRPKILALDLLPPRLLVVDPPVSGHRRLSRPKSAARSFWKKRRVRKEPFVASRVHHEMRYNSATNSSTVNPACLMMARNVPRLRVLPACTGTVVVLLESLGCSRR